MARCKCGCNRPLVEWLSKPSLFASEACRSKVRRSAASKDYAEWLSAKFEPPPDLHVALLELAPEDAWTYRLDCPSPKGGRRYYPQASSWRLRPWRPPQVPRAGLYRVSYYGESGALMNQEPAPIVGVADFVKIGVLRCDTRRLLVAR